jgi:hypothetical protein
MPDAAPGGGKPEQAASPVWYAQPDCAGGTARRARRGTRAVPHARRRVGGGTPALPNGRRGREARQRREPQPQPQPEVSRLVLLRPGGGGGGARVGGPAPGGGVACTRAGWRRGDAQLPAPPGPVAQAIGGGRLAFLLPRLTGQARCARVTQVEKGIRAEHACKSDGVARHKQRATHPAATAGAAGGARASRGGQRPPN